MKLAICLALCGLALANPVAKQSSIFCVTNWYPRLCAEYPSDTNAAECRAFQRDTIEQCCLHAGGCVDPANAWCISDYWPRQCVMASSGGCASGERFDDEASCCMGQCPTPTPVPTPPAMKWCVSSWSPLTCNQVVETDPSCRAGASDTQEQCCRGNDACLNPGSAWCQTSYWPVQCELAQNNNNCVGSGFRYTSEADCCGWGGCNKKDEQTPEVLNKALEKQSSIFCVSSWYPRLCTEYPAGTHNQACTGYARDTLEECCADDEACIDPASAWCIEAHYPLRCAEASSGTCANGDRYGSQEACCHDDENCLNPSAAWCQTSYWPVQCELAENNSNCVGSGIRYSSEADCCGWGGCSK